MVWPDRVGLRLQYERSAVAHPPQLSAQHGVSDVPDVQNTSERGHCLCSRGDTRRLQWIAERPVEQQPLPARRRPKPGPTEKPSRFRRRRSSRRPTTSGSTAASQRSSPPTSPASSSAAATRTSSSCSPTAMRASTARRSVRQGTTTWAYPPTSSVTRPTAGACAPAWGTPSARGLRPGASSRCSRSALLIRRPGTRLPLPNMVAHRAPDRAAISRTALAHSCQEH